LCHRQIRNRRKNIPKPKSTNWIAVGNKTQLLFVGIFTPSLPVIVINPPNPAKPANVENPKNTNESCSEKKLRLVIVRRLG
jgi:hypothetical protein